MKNRYPVEFKKQAVELAESLGSIVRAAEQLGISDVNIHAWKKKFGKSANLETTSKASEAEELRRLRQENAELRKVNHILKSAAAFFSQDHLK